MKTSNYDRIAADAYMTPTWCVESLLKKWELNSHDVFEPCCGTGNVVKVLEAHGYEVYKNDINDYGQGYQTDFLTLDCECNTIVTNPPYTLIKEFITKALEVTKANEGQVAFLLRHEWDAPKSHRPYLQWPFAHKFILPKRPVWFPDEDKESSKSPRFPFAWYVWDWQYGNGSPTIEWLE